jgi:hypothetical protein
VFINPSLLVVFGIVRKSRKDLYKRKNIDLRAHMSCFATYWHSLSQADIIHGNLRHKEIRPAEDARTAATYSCCCGEQQHGSISKTHINKQCPREFLQAPQRAPHEFVRGVCVWV